MSLKNTYYALTSSSYDFYEKDYYDIVDFIESTLELQEESIKAQLEVDAEIQDKQLDNFKF